MPGGRQHVATSTRSRSAGPWGRCASAGLAHLVALALRLHIWAAAPALAGPAEDSYVAGYATAVLERELDVKGSKITVKDGVITVEAAGLPQSDHEKIVATLAAIPGVTRVVVVELRTATGDRAPGRIALADDGRDPDRPGRRIRGPAARPRGPAEGAPVLAADRRSALAALLGRVPALPRRRAPPECGDRQPGRDHLVAARAPGREGRRVGGRDPGRGLQPLRPRRAVDGPGELRLPRGDPVLVPRAELLGDGAPLLTRARTSATSS